MGVFSKMLSNLSVIEQKSRAPGKILFDMSGLLTQI